MSSSADQARRLLTLLLEEKGVAAPDDGNAEELLRKTLAVDELPRPVRAALAAIVDAAACDRGPAAGQRMSLR